MAQNVSLSAFPYSPNREMTICFLLLEEVHLMDLAGPCQVFFEASQFGHASYNLVFGGVQKQINSKQGLQLAALVPFRSIPLRRGDYIFIPGTEFTSFVAGKLNQDIKTISGWLHHQLQSGIRVASVCSGALVLAEAGLLNDRKCTTHWKCIDFVKEHYPDVKVQIDQLFVEDRNVFTSAGMTSGIDMALSILEKEHGPILAAKVAREIVVYLRRNENDTQQTIYLDYKTHFNPAVHKVQDFIISHPGENPTLEHLAAIGNLSKRNLTRVFRKATGHSIVEFKNAVKIELTRSLIHNNNFSMEKISELCGFQSVRHLRRIWTKKTGMTIAKYKAMSSR